ncbi:MAG: YcxB family protein [Acidimicrobiales bacterium]
MNMVDDDLKGQQPGDGGTGSAGPGGQRVSVEFTLTRAEFASAQRQMMARSALVALASGIMAVIVVIGVVTASGYAVGIGAAWFVLIGAMFYQGPNAAWRRNPVVQGPQQHSFDEQGATLTFMGRRSEVGWDYFTKAVRGPGIYQLLRGRQFGLVVPSRAFATGRDEEAFKDLLERHVGARRRRKTSSGAAGS